MKASFLLVPNIFINALLVWEGVSLIKGFDINKATSRENSKSKLQSLKLDKNLTRCFLFTRHSSVVQKRRWSYARMKICSLWSAAKSCLRSKSIVHSISHTLELRKNLSSRGPWLWRQSLPRACRQLCTAVSSFVMVSVDRWHVAPISTLMRFSEQMTKVVSWLPLIPCVGVSLVVLVVMSCWGWKGIVCDSGRLLPEKLGKWV